MWAKNISATVRDKEYIDWRKGFHPDFKSPLNLLKFLSDVHKFLLLFELILKSKMAVDDLIASSKLRFVLLFWKKKLMFACELVSWLSPATLLKKRLWHRCFPVSFSKFLRTPFSQNTSELLLLKLS